MIDTEIIVFLTLLFGSVIAAFIIRYVLRSSMKKIYANAKSDIDHRILNIIEKPIFKLLVSGGINI